MLRIKIANVSITILFDNSIYRKTHTMSIVLLNKSKPAEILKNISITIKINVHMCNIFKKYFDMSIDKNKY